MATACLRVDTASLWAIYVDFGRAPVSRSLGSRGFNSGSGTPIYCLMAQWKSSTTRQPPMTKDELRLMLAEAGPQHTTEPRNISREAPKVEDDQA